MFGSPAFKLVFKTGVFLWCNGEFRLHILQWTFIKDCSSKTILLLLNAGLWTHLEGSTGLHSLWHYFLPMSKDESEKEIILLINGLYKWPWTKIVQIYCSWGDPTCKQKSLLICQYSAVEEVELTLLSNHVRYKNTCTGIMSIDASSIFFLPLTSVILFIF